MLRHGVQRDELASGSDRLMIRSYDRPAVGLPSDAPGSGRTHSKRGWGASAGLNCAPGGPSVSLGRRALRSQLRRLRHQVVVRRPAAGYPWRRPAQRPCMIRRTRYVTAGIPRYVHSPRAEVPLARLIAFVLLVIPVLGIQV